MFQDDTTHDDDDVGDNENDDKQTNIVSRYPGLK